jgi:hypothetical protein
MFLNKASVLFGIIQTLCCVERNMSALRNGHGILDDLDPEEQEHELADNDESDIEQLEEDTGTFKTRERKPIDKAFMSVIAFTVMNSARSQRTNGIPVESYGVILHQFDPS